MDGPWVTYILLPFAVTAAVLLVLWPTRHSGTRLLQRWGLPAPAEPQVAEAVRYLRRRRLIAVGLFLVLPPVAGLVWPAVDDNATPGNIVVALVAAMLVAELLAYLRPPGGIRVASLNPRGWRDVLPRWAVVMTAVLTAVAVALAALGLAAQPWADRYAAALPPDDGDLISRARLAESGGWYTIAGVAACLAVVGTLVFLAVRRPAVSDQAVDMALRTRTARVAVGIGFVWLTALVFTAQARVGFLAYASAGTGPVPPAPGWLTPGLELVLDVFGFVLFVAAVVCWSWLAMPSRRTPVRRP